MPETAGRPVHCSRKAGSEEQLRAQATARRPALPQARLPPQPLRSDRWPCSQPLAVSSHQMRGELPSSQAPLHRCKSGWTDSVRKSAPKICFVANYSIMAVSSCKMSWTFIQPHLLKIANISIGRDKRTVQWNHFLLTIPGHVELHQLHEIGYFWGSRWISLSLSPS